MKIGYARVSTIDQNLDLQLNALTIAGCETIYREKISGASKERPELDKMLAHLRTGDQVVIWKLDRLGRSLTHLIELVNTLADRNIGLISLNDPVDTTTAQGRLIFRIFASLSEFERDMIKERTMAGLEAARLKGKVGGKPKGLSEEAQKTARVVESLYKEGYAIKRIAEQLKIARQTVYKYLEHRNVPLSSSIEAN